MRILKEKFAYAELDLLRKHWHLITAQEVLTLLDTSEIASTCLRSSTAQNTLGLNTCSPGKAKVPWLRFLQPFNNPVIYILLAASLVTILMKDPG